MDTSSESKSRIGFFKFVFNFDEDTKATLLNLIQYYFVALIPMVALVKVTQKFSPNPDEEKNSFEILAEVLFEFLVIFVGFFFIRRLIVYVPTYSETQYPKFDVTFITLVVLFLTMNMQTKIGEKINILCQRLSDVWSGERAGKKKKSNKSTMGTSSGGGSGGGAGNAGGGGISESSVQSMALMNGTTNISTLPSPQFNNFYAGNNNSSQSHGDIGANQDAGNMILPANEVLGSSLYGSTF